MLNYIIRRLLILPLLLIGISILIFSLISLMSPLDRARAFFPTNIPEKSMDYEGLIKKYDLDDPMHVQYWNWMTGKTDPNTGEIHGGVLRGNLGWSHIGKSAVTDVIIQRLPATAELVLWSAVPMIILGIWMGIKAAVNHNKTVDQILRISAILGWSVPAYVFGLALLFLFYSHLDWFPPGRLSMEMADLVRSTEFISYTNMYTIDSLLNFRLDVFLDALKHLILPSITLSLSSWAFLLRVTRSSMLDTLHQDYINIARSKGLPEKMIVRRHALPNALIPVITVGGLIFIGLFNGVVITEAIFDYPGLGSFLAKGAFSLDLVSVAGVTLFSSVLLVIGNLIIDVLYGVLDPRIRLD